jgi:hypothetical protein
MPDGAASAPAATARLSPAPITTRIITHFTAGALSRFLKRQAFVLIFFLSARRDAIERVRRVHQCDRFVGCRRDAALVFLRALIAFAFSPYKPGWLELFLPCVANPRHPSPDLQGIILPLHCESRRERRRADSRSVRAKSEGAGLPPEGYPTHPTGQRNILIKFPWNK